jgi:four helix bundle protein
MTAFGRFEEIEVWKLSMELCTEVYKITNLDQFSKDFGLKDQIRRSAVSVPSNIAEGYERDGKNQFIYFLNIAKASCGELRTQLTIARNLEYITENEFIDLYEKSSSVSRQIKGFISYLKQYKNNK